MGAGNFRCLIDVSYVGNMYKSFGEFGILLRLKLEDQKISCDATNLVATWVNTNWRIQKRSPRSVSGEFL